VDAETPDTQAAVAATRGEILTHGGAPILAVYHSASGGRTASAEEVWGRRVPYLVSVSVEDEEDSPDTYWRASIPRTTLGPALAPLGLRVGDIRGLRVSQRTASGRAAWVLVEGAAGSERIEARALRRALGAEVIRSTLFEIRPGPAGFVIVGSGHGHGVGMSQWGARAMARRGLGYREILAAFYPGCRLGRAAEVAAR
jgi:stage II sporulation protein D